MKFLTTLQWPLRIWQVFGMAPFGVSAKPLLPIKNTQLQFYAVIFWIVCFICFILTVAFSSVYIDWKDDSIGKYDDLIAEILVWLLCCVILGEAILTLKKQTDFLLQIIRIDFILARKLQIQIDYKKYQFQNNVLTAIWICVILFCLICVYIVMCVRNDPFMINLWLIYAAPMLIYSLHYHRMVLYVYVIRRRYQMLNQYIEKVCILEEKGILNVDILQVFKQMSKIAVADFTPEKLFSELQLKEIRNVYQMLYDSTIMINDMFQWSLPLCICVDFHRLLVNTFVIFAVWLLRTYWLILVLAIIWGSTNIFHLVILSHICHSTCIEVNFRIIYIQIHVNKTNE